MTLYVVPRVSVMERFLCSNRTIARHIHAEGPRGAERIREGCTNKNKNKIDLDRAVRNIKWQKLQEFSTYSKMRDYF